MAENPGLVAYRCDVADGKADSRLVVNVVGQEPSGVPAPPLKANDVVGVGFDTDKSEVQENNSFICQMTNKCSVLVKFRCSSR